MLADLVALLNTRAAALTSINAANATLAQTLPALAPAAYGAMSDPILDDYTRRVLLALRDALAAGDDFSINAASLQLLNVATQLVNGGSV